MNGALYERIEQRLLTERMRATGGECGQFSMPTATIQLQPLLSDTRYRNK